jgi:hypothetical protein
VSNCDWSAPLFPALLLHASLSPFHVDYTMQASPPNGQWHLRIPPPQGFFIIHNFEITIINPSSAFLVE